MKKLTKVFYCNVALLLLVLLLVGCSGGTNDEAKTDASNSEATQKSDDKTNKTEENNQVDKDKSESTKDTEVSGTGSSDESTTDSSDASTTQETTTDESESTSKGESSVNESKETSSDDAKKQESDSGSEPKEEDELSNYSAAQIEYARVWLQLGTIKDIDELNIRHIAAGELVKPDNNESAAYPEDVIQLAGGRLVDGSVTYSSNGDGTINVYSVPLRWDGVPDDELGEGVIREITEDIINNTKKVSVDTGNNEEIIKLIDSMNSN
ncbi:hypothetical protein SAMN05421503_1441 [Terribacillus aidingensis]|uniref:Lipoprotein n=1 Tax=Terribacillus aidingensis TaxID=586416 RepID=A0A285NQ38_9BACI|nr:hypothetical protein [Terribacillus aidingensis]SNZ09966.1 hypothetical protein SAMN05421503_1441 [Terribacillus aidingensis]